MIKCSSNITPDGLNVEDFMLTKKYVGFKIRS